MSKRGKTLLLAHLFYQWMIRYSEQQRVAIARAIAAQPDILIFDEPTASLDGDTGRKILEFIRTEILNPNRCIIIVTHDSRIFEYADAMMKMEDGKLIEIERLANEK